MRPMSLFEIGESDGSMSLAALFAGERPQAPAGAISVRTFAELVVRGGWPLKLPLAITAAAKANRDYLKTIAEVDFDRVGGARRDPNRVMWFFRALGRNVAMELKVARIAAEVHGDDARSIARSTAYDYLNNFERLMVIETQPAWSTQLRSPGDLAAGCQSPFCGPVAGCGRAWRITASAVAGPQCLRIPL